MKYITFSKNLVQLHIPSKNAWKLQTCLLTQGEKDEDAKIPEEVLNAVIPWVWTLGKPEWAKSVVSIKSEPKSGVQLLRKNNILPNWRHKKDWNHSLITFWNMNFYENVNWSLILPFYWQESIILRNIRWYRICGKFNSWTVDVHLVVPNPYTLLTSIPENNFYFTVLDLKRCFLLFSSGWKESAHLYFQMQKPDRWVKDWIVLDCIITRTQN